MSTLTTIEERADEEEKQFPSSSSSSRIRGRYLAIVHIGAGYHSKEREKAYLSILRKALKTSSLILRNGGSSLSAVEQTISYLEDSPFTNSGTGSNLTLNGQVECDASVMKGDTKTFGAVGAVNGVPNPVKIATQLIREIETETPLSCGRIKPLFLVSEGAKSWAREHGIPTVDGDGNEEEEEDGDGIDAASSSSSSMITTEAKRAWLEYTRRVMIANSRAQKGLTSTSTSPSNSSRSPSDSESLLYDTVGAVCLDLEGVISAGVSSGGIALKHSGRVGEAAVFGSGCWADSKVGVSVTGTGELIIKSLLAKKAAKKLSSHHKHKTRRKKTPSSSSSSSASSPRTKKRKFKEEKQEVEEGDEEVEGEDSEIVLMNLLKGFLSKGRKEKRYAGLVALVRNITGDSFDIIYGHTTSSMGVGWLKGTKRRREVKSEKEGEEEEEDKKEEEIEVRVSRMDRVEQEGVDVSLAGTRVRL